MSCKNLLLVLSAFLLAGCGKSTITPASTAGTTPSSSPGTSVQVTSPTAGAAVSSPFHLNATATACQSETVTQIGYSIDQGEASQVFGTSLQVQAEAAAGPHTLHVIAWGGNGSSCQTDVAISVTDASTGNPASGPSTPQNALTVSEIQQLPDWKAEHDANTGAGTSDGALQLVSSPSMSGAALQLETNFTKSGGERYHVGFDPDPVATHFLYDTWIYIVSPSDSIANIEMDMNQVIKGGQTVIYGFQCDGYSSTWDFTENAGTPEAPDGKWVHASAPCNIKDWSTDTWHHVQVMYSRDDAGNVTYETVWLDGARQDINQTVPSSFALGWAPVLLTNLQVDGRGESGSNTIYLDHLTLSRW